MVARWRRGGSYVVGLGALLLGFSALAWAEGTSQGQSNPAGQVQNDPSAASQSQAGPAQTPANPPTSTSRQANSPKTSGSTAQTEADQPFRPRLPMYYTRVVTEEQRQKIYAIQRDYYPKISALRKQLEALIAEQNAKIEAVLTPEQKAELDKIRAEAASRRKSNADNTTDSSAGQN